MKYKIATIFEGFESVHWTKDVGIIPQIFTELTKEPGIIICRGKKKYEEEFNGVKLYSISSRLWMTYFIKALFIIVINRVTLINVYHLSKKNYIWLVFAKLLGVKSFLKLDMDMPNALRMMKHIAENKIKTRFTLYLQVLLCDFITIEDSELYVLLKKHTFFKKLQVLPNCIWDDNRVISHMVEQCVERENVIIVVGRIGAYQKNHEIILEAVRDVTWKDDWKMLFIGGYNNDFEIQLKKLLEQDPVLKNNIFLCGNKDRDELDKIYLRAKVYLSTSRWEGFSLAMTEAAYHGCYIISTPVGGVKDITNNGKYGKIIRSSKHEVAKEIQEIIDNAQDLTNSYKERVNYVHQNFEWTIRIKKIFADGVY
ncbi:glycosyltransferase [Citrobacter sedlakii]|uniref:glycosyltransferase family 4 protein n=1 Tax=Citrobacter TaxID=544 RepID=UPI001969CF88|nr:MULTISPECIES: glycosyltransferase [Citrobacter]MBM9569394.1 glycosyltransferase [Citrobacter sedlakii]MEB0951764.1 glycosyltransferase [Citrobacter sedlakii]HBL4690847.1 glycosyltransferase [Citrobacter sedlakii]HBL4705757.1 glycosyltransferase [Citrobacter sedlakii]HBL4720035.1 glycosyltransferase [Citrobacter sedlakii]